MRLYYNRASSCLFVNGTEIIKFKAKDSEIVAASLCLGSVSKDFSVDNINKTGLNGYIYIYMYISIYMILVLIIMRHSQVLSEKE